MTESTREVAKTAGKAIDAVQGFGRFLDQVLGRGLRELGDTFHDWATVYRYQNALRLSDKIEAIHKARGLEGQSVPTPPRLAIPIIRHATEEDDESLQDMWAALIANTTDPNSRLEVRRGFVNLLSAMEPLDAAVLRAIAEDEIKNPARHLLIWESNDPEQADDGRNVTWLGGVLNEDARALRLSVENLGRLGLIFDESPPDMSLITSVTNSSATLGLTFTARELLAVCGVPTVIHPPETD